ncbi:MAG: hypothetical protein E5W39_03295, partial [Mesorhizobium sp.]
YEVPPLTSGLGFTVAWDKQSDFRGRAALEPQRGQMPQRRLVNLAVPGDAPLMFGTEPVSRECNLVGYLCSARFGRRLRCS